MKSLLTTIVLFLLYSGINAQQALNLTASPQWVNIHDLDVPGTQLTVEALFYRTAGSGPNLVSKHTGPPNVNYLLRPTTFEITTGGSGFNQMPNPFPVQNNTWYHIAGTYDGSYIRYYLNGCLIVEQAWNGNMVTNNLNTAIGNISSSPYAEQFLGMIDEVRIWNVARTQAQIQANMTNLPSPTTQTGLLAYYQFEGNLINAQGNATWNGTAVGAISYATANANVQPFAFTSASIQPPTCAGAANGSVTITTNQAAASYSSDGVNFAGTNTFSGLIAGTYTFYSRSIEGCVLDTQVVVPAGPQLTVNATAPATVCVGGSLSLSANASLSSSYTWSGPNGFSSTQQNPSITNISAGNDGTYTVTATYSGCTASNTINFAVTPNKYTTQNIAICYNATFTRPNGTTVNTNGTYIDTVQAVSGCDSIITTNLTVSPNALSATGNATICLGDSTPINATGGLAYFWSPSAGLSDSSIANPIAFPTTTTPYIVRSGLPGQSIISNGDFEQGNSGFSSAYTYQSDLTPAGVYYVGSNPNTYHSGFSACQDHTSGTGNMMIINGAGSPNLEVFCKTVTVTPNTDYAFGCWVASVAAGSPAILQFEINNSLLTTPFSAPTATCTWQQFYAVWNSGNNTSANICIINQNTTGGGNDFALDDITFSEICTVYDTVTIVVNQPAFTTQNPVICDNETYTRPSGIVVNTAGTYVDTLTTVNGCDSIITSNLSVNPTFALTLNPVICANESYTRPSGIVVNTAGTYTDVLTTVNGCDSVITTELSVNPIYQVSVSDTICSYQNYTRPSGIVVNSSGTYIDTLNTVNGCDSVITTSLTVINLTLSHTSVDVLCNGENTGSISVSQSGGLLPVSYSWNNVSLSGNTPSNIPAGSYSVTATDAFGCTANDAVVINEPTLLVFSAAFTEPLCHGEANGTISIVPQGGVPPYQFSLNNQLSDSGSFANLSAGSYNLVVTDSHNCSEQSNLVVTEPDLLEIYYQPTVLTMYLGQQIDLDLSTNYNSNVSFSWEPPTGLSCSDCSSPVMKPNVTTNYVLTVTANPHGKDCVYEFPFTVTVFPERTFYIPNAFSPNGDNSNDEFRIFFKEKSAVKQLFIKIFNRWGEKVFEANEADFAWDGKFKGLHVPPGNYVYELSMVFLDNVSQQINGSIALLQ